MNENRRPVDPLEARLAEQLIQARLHAVTLHAVAELDMTDLLDLVSSVEPAFVAKYGMFPGRMPFFIKAAVQALRATPALMTRIDGEELLTGGPLDFSIALPPEGCQFLPVVRDCDAKSLADLAAELSALADKARAGALTIPELQGGVLTLAERSDDAVLFGTPALNPPQCAALVIHAPRPRPIVCAGVVRVRPVAHLVLAYDARVASPDHAATFLQAFENALPEAWIQATNNRHPDSC